MSINKKSEIYILATFRKQNAVIKRTTVTQKNMYDLINIKFHEREKAKENVYCMTYINFKYVKNVY